MPFCLRQAKVAFTGKLASLSRKEACQIVYDAGGEVTPGVSRRTSMLVVGMEGWPLLPDGMISSKLRHAEDLMRRGFPLRIISESAFLELAGRKEPQAVLRKAYPAPEVCRLLKISPQTLRRWEQFGLVRAEGGSYDFQDLISLRNLVELVNRGVQASTLARSLRDLSAVLPGTDRPLAQLKIVVENPKSIVVDVGEFLIAPSGQLAINFDGEPKLQASVVRISSDERTDREWFEYGQVSEEEELYSEAEDAYRQAIALAPQFPEAYFNLGNVVRALGRLEEARECYHTAVVQDTAMATAWYNLADVQEELGCVKEAVSSLRSAIQVHPTFADAHFNLALCYEKLGQTQNAADHWRSYLKLDPTSEWSEIARRHLAGAVC